MTISTDKNRHWRDNEYQLWDGKKGIKAYQSLKRVKKQRQWFAQPPSDNNQDRDDKQRDLDTRSDGNIHRQIELSLPGDHDCSCVFRGIGNYRDDNKGNPLFVERRMLDETVDTVDEVLGGEVGDDCNGDQKEQGRRCVHTRIFNVVR